MRHSSSEQKRAPSAVTVVALGIFTGALAGFFGVGGGILFVPALIYLLTKSPHEATLTSLAIIFPVAIASSAVYYSEGHLHLGGTALLALGAVVGSAALGVPLAARLSGPALKQAFGCILMLAAIRMFLTQTPAQPIRSAAALSAGGVLIGFVSGFFGVGGGIVAVPILRAALAFEQHEAHAASLGIMIPTALAGLLRAWISNRYRPDLRTAAAWAPWAIVGALLGPLLADRVSAPALQWAFAGFLLLVSLEMTGLLRWVRKAKSNDRMTNDKVGD